MSVGTDFSIKGELGLTSESVTETFSASSIGGDNFSALTLPDFLANYANWATSMNDQTEYSNIVDLPDRSLAAIWDILPEQYAEAGRILSECFDQEALSGVRAIPGKIRASLYRSGRQRRYPPFRRRVRNAGTPPILSAAKSILKTSALQSILTNISNSATLWIWESATSRLNFPAHSDGNGYTIEYTQTIGAESDFCGGLFSVLNGAHVSDLYINAYIAEKEDDLQSDGRRLGGKSRKQQPNRTDFRRRRNQSRKRRGVKFCRRHCRLCNERNNRTMPQCGNHRKPCLAGTDGRHRRLCVSRRSRSADFRLL